MTTYELHSRLLSLNAEQAAASLMGLDRAARSTNELQAEIEATRHALVGAAVTEIATFRAQLNGPQVG